MTGYATPTQVSDGGLNTLGVDTEGVRHIHDTRNHRIGLETPTLPHHWVDLHDVTVAQWVQFVSDTRGWEALER